MKWAVPAKADPGQAGAAIFYLQKEGAQLYCIHSHTKESVKIDVQSKWITWASEDGNTYWFHTETGDVYGLARRESASSSESSVTSGVAPSPAVRPILTAAIRAVVPEW